MTDRIMVIDDDSLMRETLCALLQSAGFRASAFASAKEALQATSAHRLAIIDVFMPDMDGIELTSRLRERHPLIGIIAMSGGGLLPGHDVLLDCLLLGAHAALEKPFAKKDLLAAIATAREASRVPLPH